MDWGEVSWGATPRAGRRRRRVPPDKDDEEEFEKTEEDDKTWISACVGTCASSSSSSSHTLDLLCIGVVRSVKSICFSTSRPHSEARNFFRRTVFKVMKQKQHILNILVTLSLLDCHPRELISGCDN